MTRKHLWNPLTLFPKLGKHWQTMIRSAFSWILLPAPFITLAQSQHGFCWTWSTSIVIQYSIYPVSFLMLRVARSRVLRQGARILNSAAAESLCSTGCESNAFKWPNQKEAQGSRDSSDARYLFILVNAICCLSYAHSFNTFRCLQRAMSWPLSSFHALMFMAFGHATKAWMWPCQNPLSIDNSWNEFGAV